MLKKAFNGAILTVRQRPETLKTNEKAYIRLWNIIFRCNCSMQPLLMHSFIRKPTSHVSNFYQSVSQHPTYWLPQFWNLSGPLAKPQDKKLYLMVLVWTVFHWAIHHTYSIYLNKRIFPPQIHQKNGRGGGLLNTCEQTYTNPVQVFSWKLKTVNWGLSYIQINEVGMC
jgi:hypothetical protein